MENEGEKKNEVKDLFFNIQQTLKRKFPVTQWTNDNDNKGTRFSR